MNHTSDEPARFTPESHLATLVTFNEDPAEPDKRHLYMTDVGFGGLGLVAPIPLQLHAEIKGALNEYHRISMVHHPESSLEEGGLPDERSFHPPCPLHQNYCLQSQAREPDGTPVHDWRTLFMFDSAEAYAEDIAYSHYAVSRLQWLFTHNVIACRHVEHPETEALGRITLFNDTMTLRTKAGADEEVTKLTSEKERIQVLQDKFGLGNLPTEAESIIRKRGIALA